MKTIYNAGAAPMSNRKPAVETEPRDGLGRFGPGNPGRRRGSRNRSTVAALALLDKGAKGITQKAISMALAGDSAAMKLCLERLIAPNRERPVMIDIPMPASAADVPATLQAIIGAASRGEISAGEAERFSRCVDGLARAHELADFDSRLKALEAKHAH